MYFGLCGGGPIPKAWLLGLRALSQRDPELVYGKIETPAQQGADFPDAPDEPHVAELMPSDHWMLFGLANDEIGYITPKTTVGRRRAVLLRTLKIAIRQNQQLRPGQRHDSVEVAGSLYKEAQVTPSVARGLTIASRPGPTNWE